jgi:hypothetical protein
MDPNIMSELNKPMHVHAPSSFFHSPMILIRSLLIDKHE